MPQTFTNAPPAPIVRRPAVSGRVRLRDGISCALRPYFKPTRSHLLPSVWRYVLMRPIPFEVWFRARAAWFLLTRRWQVRAAGIHGQAAADHHARVVDHNFGQRWLFNRARTEKLMNVLRSIGSVSRHSRILVIGPRNEAEILLLSLYGFRLKNITGIDLLTYSPKILQMDMHDLRFPDSAFDVVYSLYTLPYAYDLRRACAEIVRVLRNGGVLAAGFQQTPVSPKNLRAPGSELRGGLAEFLDCFGGHVDHVFWQEQDPTAESDEDYRLTTVLRIRK
jgi:SAM-dependent methyltransferase